MYIWQWDGRTVKVVGRFGLSLRVVIMPSTSQAPKNETEWLHSCLNLLAITNYTAVAQLYIATTLISQKSFIEVEFQIHNGFRKRRLFS